MSRCIYAQAPPDSQTHTLTLPTGMHSHPFHGRQVKNQAVHTSVLGRRHLQGINYHAVWAEFNFFFTASTHPRRRLLDRAAGGVIAAGGVLLADVPQSSTCSHSAQRSLFAMGRSSSTPQNRDIVTRPSLHSRPPRRSPARSLAGFAVQPIPPKACIHRIDDPRACLLPGCLSALNEPELPPSPVSQSRPPVSLPHPIPPLLFDGWRTSLGKKKSAQTGGVRVCGPVRA
ncbi:hypothetical protein DFH27DRAFT_228243 [Peziza echinospora]|nr:hypothetical protein DFH27DRAFT_228243 [Peziza echinospora]